MRALTAVVRSVLLRTHYGVKNFAIDDASARADEKLILSVIELLLLSTGLLALFVGGINVMNVMLVTVTERTREIGIRRAVGARQRDVLAQFLVESTLLTAVGGLCGVGLGTGATWLAAAVLRRIVGAWSFHLEPWSVALGLGLSIVTGVGFGLYPAWRAARVDPITALRFE